MLRSCTNYERFLMQENGTKMCVGIDNDLFWRSGRGQDFQKCIINFPCHSYSPFHPFPRRSALRKSLEPRRQYCWPFRSTVPKRLSSFTPFPHPIQKLTPRRERGDFTNKQLAPISPFIHFDLLDSSFSIPNIPTRQYQLP